MESSATCVSGLVVFKTGTGVGDGGTAEAKVVCREPLTLNKLFALVTELHRLLRLNRVKDPDLAHFVEEESFHL